MNLHDGNIIAQIYCGPSGQLQALIAGHFSRNDFRDIMLAQLIV